MSKSITTKYGTKINVDGLTPEQVKQVKAIAENNGAYGAKGAALADSLRKKNAGKPAKPTTPAASNPLGIDAKTGDVNPNTATDAILTNTEQDTQKNFNMNNPGSQTDALGNTQNIEVDPVTGQTKITKSAGGSLSAVNNAFTNAATGLGDDGRAQARDASYGYLSKDFATNKAQELEATKQELAQRGIPIDPTEGSLWSKSIKQIDSKYQALDDQARNQSIDAGNRTYATNVGAVGTLGNTVAGQTPAFTAFAGGTANQGGASLSALQAIAGFNMERYKTDQAYKLEMDNIAVRRLAASKSGGGSGGGGGGGDIITNGAPV